MLFSLSTTHLHTQPQHWVIPKTGLQDMVKKWYCDYLNRNWDCSLIHDYYGWLIVHHDFHFHWKISKIKMMWHFSCSLPNKHVLSHLENKLCWPGHLFSTTKTFYLYKIIPVLAIWNLHLVQTWILYEYMQLIMRCSLWWALSSNAPLIIW